MFDLLAWTKSGFQSILEAELWAIFFGLHYALQMGFTHIEIQSISQVAINLLVKSNDTRVSLNNTISACR